jgi:hypothetical protein
LYGGLAYFAIVRKSPFGTRQQLLRVLTAHEVRMILPSVDESI